MNFIKKIFLLFLFLCIENGIIWAQSNTPPTIIAIGNQSYCPLSEIKIVTQFDIIDPDDDGIFALFIQISTGYDSGADQLMLSNSGSHPNVATQWNSSQGKLTISSTNSGDILYIDLIAAVKDVVFISNSQTVSGEKYFSFTIGNANYLPSTGHYYEYVSYIGITWTDARVAAENRQYYGLQGYLATITTPEEAQLTGEQAAGAGWIGGNDVETEEVWRWVTGPENGMIFWNGLSNGSAPNGAFTFWNTGEPNSAGGNEDYVHITAPNVGIRGSWNDLPNNGTTGDYEPKGYIVEYGGMPGETPPNISASTKIYVPEVNSTQPSSTCGPGEVTLSADSELGEIHWFESETSLTPLFTGDTFITPTLTESKLYYVLASQDDCYEGIRTPVQAAVYEIPIIQPDVTLKNCDEDGSPDGYVNFNLREADEFISLGDDSLMISYYLTSLDADLGVDPVDPSPFNNATASIVYARAENVDGCYDIATVQLEVSTTTFPPGFDQELFACDDDDAIDGLSTFDLTEASDIFLDQLPAGQNLVIQYYRNLTDAQLEENEILPQNNYKNEIPFVQILYVRVESNDNGDCYGIGPHLILNVNPRPEFDVNPNDFVCLNLDPITLETFNPSGIYTYKWTDESGSIISTEPSAVVSNGGLYTVIATSSLACESFPHIVTVDESNIATITEDDITVVGDSENNSITIDNSNNNLGIGDYEFALDNGYGPYQDEPFFEYVFSGIHTVFVRDKNGCGVVSIEVPVIGYPKFFTPNNDGYNDYWQVQGINEYFYPTSLIYIFDRFGKIIANVDPTSEGWNGIYNGTLLPSSDYWFSVQLTDQNGISHERKGHFSLITE